MSHSKTDPKTRQRIEACIRWAFESEMVSRKQALLERLDGLRRVVESCNDPDELFRMERHIPVPQEDDDS